MRVHRPLALTVLLPLAAVAASPAGAASDASSPKALLAATTANVAKLRSYHVVGTQTTDDGRGRVTADVTASGQARVTLSQAGSGRFELRVVPSGAFLRANAAFWRASAGKDADAAVVKKLANHWLAVGKEDAKDFGSVLNTLKPSAVARCLRTTGTLSAGAPASVGSQKARVLVDAGDKRGTAPGKLYVSAKDPALPLRLLQTGKARPGGSSDCIDADDTTSHSDLRFSRFDEKVSIPTPKDAIQIPEDAGGVKV